MSEPRRATRPAQSELLVLAPTEVEARAVAALGVRVAHIGVGPSSAAAGAAQALSNPRPAAVAIVGVADGLVDEVPPGTTIVADRLLDPSGRPVGPPLPSAPLVAAALRQAGLAVRVGPIVCADRLVRGEASRSALAADGALAVDTESFFALQALDFDGPVAVVRVVATTPVEARDALHAAMPALASWARAAGPRTVLVASPRSFCAGVERAIHTVEQALERFGAPVYVRRQIVHNRHVVADLEARGAIFVQELDEVPDGATVVFSAHGVAPAVRAEAGGRDLRVIDATCPLVARVHTEVRRFRDRGFQVVLIGHDGHDETEGTLGEAPDIQLITTPDDVAGVEASDPERVAYVTQTTLAPDDVTGVVEALQDRFPSLVGPHAADICYATQNRQDAVMAMVADCDLLLVVGSRNSSNTARLAEVAQRAGCRAEVIDDETEIDPRWLAGATAVGVTAGASAPQALVGRVVSTLSGLGPVSLEERSTRTETVTFPLPVEVR